MHIKHEVKLLIFIAG